MIYCLLSTGFAPMPSSSNSGPSPNVKLTKRQPWKDSDESNPVASRGATPQSRSQEIICRHCNATFKHKNALHRHESAHKKRNRAFVCDACQKIYTRVEHLRRHMLSHSGSFTLNTKIPSVIQLNYNYDMFYVIVTAGYAGVTVLHNRNVSGFGWGGVWCGSIDGESNHKSRNEGT